MPHNLKKYFTTSLTERKGMFTLVLLLMLVISFYWVDDYFYDSTPVVVEVEEIVEIRSLKEKSENYKASLHKTKQDLFQFNPNLIEKEEWIRLGFSTNQAQSIINFRNSGFKFKTKEDLKKLFVVDEKKYQQLAPYVIIPKQKLKEEKQCYRILFVSNEEPIYEGLENLGPIFYKKDKNSYKYYSSKYNTWSEANQKLTALENVGFEGAFIAKLSCDFKCYPIQIRERKEEKFVEVKRIVVELNKADTAELKTLKGVGSYYAKKIVAYRERLGGFYNENQLLEVYGIDQEVLERNKGFVSLDTALVIKININTISKEELKKHPYIKWNVANSIILYRANHGKYESVQNIQNSDLVNDELYRKIVRYLTVE